MSNFYVMCLCYILLFIPSGGQLLPKAEVYKKNVDNAQCKEKKLLRYNLTNSADSHFNIKWNNSYDFVDFWRQNLQSFIAQEPINIRGISFVLNYSSFMIKPYNIILTIRFHVSKLNATPILTAVNGRIQGRILIIIPIDNVIRIDFFPKPVFYNLHISKVKIWVKNETTSQSMFSFKRFGDLHYYFSDTNLSYYDARDFCSQNNMTLTRVINNEHNEWLAKKIPLSSDYWIGLNDIEAHRVWKWEDGTSLTLNAWSSGEPNGKETKNCGIMNRLFENFEGPLIGHDNCSITERFMCENTGQDCSSLFETLSEHLYDCGDYDGTSYYQVNRKMTFYNASEYCRSLTGGKLITIKEGQHMNWTAKFSFQVNKLSQIFWIGLKYDGRIWKWSNGTQFNSAYDYLWVGHGQTTKGKPPKGIQENCVAISSSVPNNFFDDDCSKQRKFICEIKRDFKRTTTIQPKVSSIRQIDIDGRTKSLSPDNLNIGSYQEDKDWLVKCVQTDIMEGNKNPPSCPSDPLLFKSRMLIEFEDSYNISGIIVYHFPGGLLQKYRTGDYVKEFEEYNSYLWFVGEMANTERIPCWYSEVDNIKPSMDMIYELDCTINDLKKLHIACETVYECRILLCGLKLVRQIW